MTLRPGAAKGYKPFGEGRTGTLKWVALQEQNVTRQVHAEGLRERQNMKQAAHTRKTGDFVVVGFTDRWDQPGLQGRGYESREEAQEKASEIAATEEYRGVLHEVMLEDEYDALMEDYRNA